MQNSSCSKPSEKGDFYYNAEGYMVFTAKYLLKRGYCCKNGCKHCPYGNNKIVPPVKSKENGSI